MATTKVTVGDAGLTKNVRISPALYTKIRAKGSEWEPFGRILERLVGPLVRERPKRKGGKR